ncbi:hypothetical protein GCM10025859_62050 [Alicyclobacillus fastidiosus]|nr:hypothetical protein GCM10025859_62050 [Alicyclobacillus fastidiosus]
MAISPTMDGHFVVAYMIRRLFYTRYSVLVQKFTKPQYTVVYRNRIHTTYGVLKYFCTRTTKPVSKPTPQETAKTKFEAELQQVKDHTIKLNAQQQLQFEKEYIQYDKPGLLSMNRPHRTWASQVICSFKPIKTRLNNISRLDPELPIFKRTAHFGLSE